MRYRRASVPPGSRVAVVAPSSPIQRDLLEEGLTEVRALGFEPVVADDVEARWRFAAGTEERRLGELRRAFADPSIRAVWCARGGGGASALLRSLDPATLLADPKPIIGESDATFLGSWAMSHGLAWIHGPMVASSLRKGDDGYDRQSLGAALAGAAASLSPRGVRALRAGSAEGTLWGGCLSMLASACGTPWLRPPPRGLLLVEDVGVKPYQVHRMFVQLRDSGALEGVQGVVIGDFVDSVQHSEQGYALDEVLLDLVADSVGDVPVTAGWPVGHAPGPHLSVCLGAPARLRVADAGSTLHVEAA